MRMQTWVPYKPRRPEIGSSVRIPITSPQPQCLIRSVSGGPGDLHFLQVPRRCRCLWLRPTPGELQIQGLAHSAESTFQEEVSLSPTPPPHLSVVWSIHPDSEEIHHGIVASSPSLCAAQASPGRSLNCECREASFPPHISYLYR